MKNKVRQTAILVVLTICSIETPQAGSLPTVGPDAYGYSGVAIGGHLRDISASGTFIPLNDDQTSGSINIGFGFNFYGVDYTNAYVSSNGFIGFTPNTPNGCCSGGLLPINDSINNVIAGLWEDLNAPQGNIRYQTLGSAGSHEFVVGFYSNPHYHSGPPVTFEMILQEASNSIEFQYGPLMSDAGIHTIGIENSDGTDRLLVRRSPLLDFSNTGYRISTVPIPGAVWLFGSGLVGLMGWSKRRALVPR